MAARLTVARIALRSYPRNLLTRWLRQRPLVDRPASIVRRWRTAPSGSSPGSRAAQSAWRRRAPPSSSRHCTAPPCTAPAVRTAHRQSSAAAREGLVSEVCGARARLSTMAELVSAVERGGPNRGAGRRRQEGGDGMCGLSPRGESRRLLVSRPYEVARRRRGLGQLAQDAGKARACDPTTRSLRNDTCAPKTAREPLQSPLHQRVR
jgi:hypothetical protein